MMENSEIRPAAFAAPGEDEMRLAVKEFRARAGKSPLRAALIDMDGVLYDSMKYHTLSWQRLMADMGLDVPRDEFYLYEGMTGTATIAYLLKREKGIELTADELKELYSGKQRYFKKLGRKELMPGAERMLAALGAGGVTRVLVTGSAQSSLLGCLDADYPGVFPAERRVTALDVKRGKPDAEPYLRGLEKAGAEANASMVIENAPLGVRSGVASGCFVVAVTTGPIPRDNFVKEGASLIFPSMPEFADALPTLIRIFNE